MLEEEGILGEVSGEDAFDQQLRFEWALHARDKQLEPDGEWYTWLALAGRGWGKTRVGAEWIRHRVETGQARRIALVGRTAKDVRDTMIEGESGILAVSPPWFRPIYKPSKRKLIWPNGAFALCFSGEEPDDLRGPNHDTAWADELASWQYDEAAWSNLLLGLRLRQPRVMVTTTPRPTKLIKEIIEDKGTHVTRGSTYENKRNLARRFLDKIVQQYEGTRLGLQELHAEVLDDTPGALWTQEMIDKHRERIVPELERIVVAIDPAVTANEGSDETGIVVAGVARIGEGKARQLHGFVLDDLSGILKPDAWSKIAIEAYRNREADRIVAEVNNGGDLVELTVRTHDPHRKISYKAVRAAKGKRTRAEPVAALYEQGRVHHVGAFAKLESQMTTYVPGNSKQRSPDRMDALVWALTDLMLGPGEFRTDFSMEQTGEDYNVEAGYDRYS